MEGLFLRPDGMYPLQGLKGCIWDLPPGFGPLKPPEFPLKWPILGLLVGDAIGGVGVISPWSYWGPIL